MRHQGWTVYHSKEAERMFCACASRNLQDERRPVPLSHSGRSILHSYS